jgi:hypothetical protein
MPAVRSNLADFLIGLAGDPVRRCAYEVEPSRTAHEAGLSDAAIAALRSGSDVQINSVVAHELGTTIAAAAGSTAPSGPGCLTVVGVGITLIEHVTLEAVAAISHSALVMYLIPTPVIVAWLHTQHPRVESLADAYSPDKLREATYEEMTERVLARVRAGWRVCFAISGHPGVGVHASHAAVRRARMEGFGARMIPGVSAEASLVADLGLDPVALGWQNFEATDFVTCRHDVDTSAGLILWQPGVVGITTAWPLPTPHRPGLRRLIAALKTYYPTSHELVVYEASTVGICEPRIVPVRLRDLAEAPISPSTTLFVPPAQPVSPRSRQPRRRMGRHNRAAVR